MLLVQLLLLKLCCCCWSPAVGTAVAVEAVLLLLEPCCWYSSVEAVVGVVAWLLWLVWVLSRSMGRSCRDEGCLRCCQRGIQARKVCCVDRHGRVSRTDNGDVSDPDAGGVSKQSTPQGPM